MLGSAASKCVAAPTTRWLASATLRLSTSMSMREQGPPEYPRRMDAPGWTRQLPVSSFIVRFTIVSAKAGALSGLFRSTAMAGNSCAKTLAGGHSAFPPSCLARALTGNTAHEGRARRTLLPGGRASPAPQGSMGRVRRLCRERRTPHGSQGCSPEAPRTGGHFSESIPSRPADAALVDRPRDRGAAGRVPGPAR